MVITIEINYEEADFDELKKVGVLSSSSAANFVSSKATKENYEKEYGIVFKEK